MSGEPEDDPNVTYAFEPDFALKKIIGEDVDISKIFTPERIKACQDIIDNARSEFFEEEKPRVLELKTIVQGGNEKNLPQILAICKEIKSQAKIFGFSFIADLCTQIITFAELETRPVKVRFQVIAKFTDALVIAVLNKMKDEGGVLEKELDKIVAEVLARA